MHLGKTTTRETHSVCRIAPSSDLLFNQSMSYEVLPSFQCGDAALHNVLRSDPRKNYGIQRKVRITTRGDVLSVCARDYKAIWFHLAVWGNILTTLSGTTVWIQNEH